jgi:uncharacterized iron-regulated protein
MPHKTVTTKLAPLALGALCLLAAANTHAMPGAGHGTRMAAAGPQNVGGSPETRVLDLSAMTDMDALVTKLADRRVVFVGETHDRYDHHLNQLQIIQGLHRQDPNLAIGLEFFQQPFQQYLDDYVAGRIDERAFLVGTEYFERWRFDYRLYRPIIRFARSEGIPLVALNVPRELTRKVAEKGLDALQDEADRAMVPAQMDRGDEHYRQRIRQVFDSHPNTAERNFEHFLDAQLLWDEGMADRAARHLEEHPGQRMVVLAGSGHLVYGQGIPKRLQRRQPVSAAIVINSAHHPLDPKLADYLLFPRQVDLPKSGLMGVFLDTEGVGVKVKGFADSSPAEEAGLKKDDQVLRIGDRRIENYTDIRLALMDRSAGEQVEVEVLRPHLLLDDSRYSYQVTLY